MEETAGEGRKRKKKRRPPSDRIGYVFQNPEFQFVAETVFEEVQFSLKAEGMAEAAETKVKARRFLRSFHLAGLEHRHPYQLSMGQKRRLSMAAAVVCGQPILLLDEPTFGQDARNTFAILEYCLKMKAQGTAIVMVTHEEEIVRQIATRVWEVLDGVVTERPPAEQSAEAEEMRVGT